MDDVQKDHRITGPVPVSQPVGGLHSKGKMLASVALAVPVHQTPALARRLLEV